MNRLVFPARARLLGCLLLGLLLVGRPAVAQDYAAAGQHFEAAQESFQKGEFRRAAEEYQAAYNITRDPSLLFQIGESWQRAGDAQKALLGYRAYVAEQPAGADRAEADKRIAAIEAVLNPTPAAPAPGTPPTAAPTPATPATTIDPAAAPPPAAAAAPAVANPTVTPAATPAAAAAPAPAATASPRRLRTGAWIAVATGVALATSGAILGLGAQNRADELQRRTTTTVSGQPPIYDQNQADAYQTLMSEGHAYNTAAISLLSVAGAAVLTGAALFVADWVTLPKESKSPLASLPLPTLAIGNGGAVAAISGSF